MNVKEVQKILIIRSARIELLKKAVELLRNKFQEAKISVLAQPIVEKELEDNYLINEVIVYSGGFLDVFKIGKGLLNKLRKERFDLVVILYNNITGKGYFHLHIISFLIAPISIFIYDIEENYYKLRFLRLFCKQTLLYLVFYPILFILFILGYIFVFLPGWTLIKMKIFIKSKGGK